ncbi:MAG: hypothetical protein RIA62_00030 [Cyclobacteriaceae bacterium]
MKKNIAILSIFTIYMLVLSYVKAQEADKNANVAMQKATEAMHQQEFAEAQAAKALSVLSELEKLKAELAECRGEK